MKPTQHYIEVNGRPLCKCPLFSSLDMRCGNPSRADAVRYLEEIRKNFAPGTAFTIVKGSCPEAANEPVYRERAIVIYVKGGVVQWVCADNLDRPVIVADADDDSEDLLLASIYETGRTMSIDPDIREKINEVLE